MKKSIGYRILIWISLILSLLLLWQLSHILIRPKSIPVDDFVRHWAAGRLLISGGDPYSPSEIQILQDQASGPEVKAPVITPNYIPPWTMPLLALFGLFDYPGSRLGWLLFNITILLASIELLWKGYGGAAQYKWIAWIVCFTFGPSISVLGKGQTSSLILLGVAGFIFFIEYKPKEWIAGAFAALISVKPQVFYLFWPIFLFWLIKYRRFKVFLGCVITISILSGISLIFDTHIFTEYLYALKYYPPNMFATPTIGGYLRYFVLGVDQFWPQFVPVLVGLAWGVIYLIKHPSAWLWSKDMPLLLFVSVLTSSYIWTYDQVILIVPVLQAWVWILPLKGNWREKLIILAHFLLSFLDLILHRYWDDFWFIWFAPATWLWYLAAKYIFKQNAETS